jgi:hypothetical protein
MESYRELFDKYKEGLLPDDKIRELNRELIGSYFRSPGDLDQEEQDYTEDLIFELFAKNRLEPGYVQIFRDKLRNNKLLSQRYLISKDLSDTARLKKSGGVVPSADPSDEREEAQLKEILREVIGKVQAEKERSAVKDTIESFIKWVESGIQELVQTVQAGQPRVRWALIVGSIAIIAGLAWFFLKPGSEDLMTNNPLKQRARTNQPMVIEKTPGQGKGNTVKDQVRKKINNLLASAAGYAPRFDYVLVRGETTPALDSFMLAADKYNQKDFNRCIAVLNGLLKRKSFTDPDTISEIHFYLGNCFLAEGIKNNNERTLKSGLRSFALIPHESQYYYPSLWYSVFAYAGLGQAAESMRLCDILIKVRYRHPADVKRLRDSLRIITDTITD